MTQVAVWGSRTNATMRLSVVRELDADLLYTFKGGQDMGDYRAGLGAAAWAFASTVEQTLGLVHHRIWREISGDRMASYGDIYSIQRDAEMVHTRTRYFHEKIGGLTASTREQVTKLRRIVNRMRDNANGITPHRGRLYHGPLREHDMHRSHSIDSVTVLKFITFACTRQGTKSGKLAFENRNMRRRTTRILRAIMALLRQEVASIPRTPPASAQDDNMDQAHRREMGALHRYCWWVVLTSQASVEYPEQAASA